MTVLVISGKSLAGKTTLTDMLVNEYRFSRVVTVTTRPARPGEVNGVHYYFVTEEAFAVMREQGQFIECEEFSGYWYGLPFSTLNSAMDRGHAVLTMEPNGHVKAAKYLAGNSIPHVSIFLDCPADLMAYRFMDRLDKMLLGQGEHGYRLAMSQTTHRLARMLDLENAWTPVASPYQPNYHIVFDEFARENQDSVVQRVIMHCDSAQRTLHKKTG